MMSRLLKYLVICIGLVTLLGGCKNGKLTPGHSISKNIVIEFDQTSIDQNYYHKFSITHDEALEVTFSKGALNGNIFTITAQEYVQIDGPIVVTVSSQKPGTYSFKMTYYSSSPGLEVEFDAGRTLSFPELIVEAKWKSYIPYIILILVIAILFGLYRLKKTRDRMRFDTGYLQINFPTNEMIELTGSRKVNLAKIIGDTDNYCMIFCQPDYSDGDELNETRKIPELEVEDTSVWINNNEEHSSNVSLTKDCKVTLKKEGVRFLEFDYSEF